MPAAAEATMPPPGTGSLRAEAASARAAPLLGRSCRDGARLPRGHPGALADAPAAEPFPSPPAVGAAARARGGEALSLALRPGRQAR